MRGPGQLVVLKEICPGQVIQQFQTQYLVDESADIADQRLAAHHVDASWSNYNYFPKKRPQSGDRRTRPQRRSAEVHAELSGFLPVRIWNGIHAMRNDLQYRSCRLVAGGRGCFEVAPHEGVLKGWMRAI